MNGSKSSWQTNLCVRDEELKSRSRESSADSTVHPCRSAFLNPVELSNLSLRIQ